jgi:uncharacterized protein (DUF1684 family)
MDTRAEHRTPGSRSIALSELEGFRSAKDSFFAHSLQSPLSVTQQESFSGLDYYGATHRFVFDVALERADDDRLVRILSSTEGDAFYRRAGVARIDVDGVPARLTLFAPEREGDLFAPFRDATNGAGTNPAGRCLKVRPPSGGRVTVDFNYAFNPSSAYNDRWTCPLPPPENWLTVPIYAGERAFSAYEDRAAGYVA